MDDGRTPSWWNSFNAGWQREFRRSGKTTAFPLEQICCLHSYGGRETNLLHWLFGLENSPCLGQSLLISLSMRNGHLSIGAVEILALFDKGGAAPRAINTEPILKVASIWLYDESLTPLKSHRRSSIGFLSPPSLILNYWPCSSRRCLSIHCCLKFVRLSQGLVQAVDTSCTWSVEAVHSPRNNSPESVKEALEFVYSPRLVKYISITCQPCVWDNNEVTRAAGMALRDCLRSV